MKTQSARELAVELFSGVPGLKRVEASLEDELWERAGVDLTFVVDDREKARQPIIRLFGQFLSDSGLAADFWIQGETDHEGPAGIVLYERKDSSSNR